MAIPIIYDWEKFFDDYDEGLGSSYERVVLNNLLAEIVSDFEVKNVLEAPCFGFTGVSGINSMNLVKEGLDVTIMDSKGKRLKLIEEVWEQTEAKLRNEEDAENQREKKALQERTDKRKTDEEATISQWNVKFTHSQFFNELPFNDKQFDLSWNFSALWFVKDLDKFLAELSRITSKVVLIIVPNTTGLGYVWQNFADSKKESPDEETGLFNQHWIKRTEFEPIMNDLGWKLLRHNYIDCPPWPDIGMKKEEFLKKIGLRVLIDNDCQHSSKKDMKKGKRNAIIDYYSGQDPDFPQRMMKYYWFEKIMPSLFKRFWAHHHYYLFVPR